MLDGGQNFAGDMQLLQSIAEQLKMPLTAIARQAELGECGANISALDFRAVGEQANTALTLVDNYLLGLRLAVGQEILALEPVSAASVLADVAHELDGFAKRYAVPLEVHIAGKYEPVMANRKALRAALTSLGYELIAAQAAQCEAADTGFASAMGTAKNTESIGQDAANAAPKPLRASLILASHRTAHGIVAGVYGDYAMLSAPRWRKALALRGRAHQPFAALSASSAAGLFVADTLLQAMTAQLRVGRYHHQQGMAATLQPSRQLQLV